MKRPKTEDQRLKTKINGEAYFPIPHFDFRLSKAISNRKSRIENRKSVFLINLFLLLISIFPSYAFTQTTSSTELISQAEKYDGKIVYFEGEVIGEVMKRKDIVWLNLSDSKNSCLGIFVPTSQIPKITYYGGYKAIGDTIRVKGIFHRACSTHGGGLDIHALSLKIVKPGHPIEHPIDIVKVRIALLLSLIAIVVIIIHLVKTKHP